MIASCDNNITLSQSKLKGTHTDAYVKKINSSIAAAQKLITYLR